MLNDTQIRKAKAEAKVYVMTDLPGLYLEVRPSGKKTWRCRFKIKGKPGIVTIGHYPAITLAQARKRQHEIKAMAKAGINPNHVDEHDPEASVADTFEQVAKEFYAQKRKTWSKDYDDRWIGGMEHRVFDAIGDKPIAEVTSRDILEIMQLAVEEGSPTSAQAVKRRTGQVFRYAIASQRIEIDPSAALAGYVHHKTKHRKGLKPTKLRKLLNDLDSSPPCHPRTALTMRLIILTFVRTKEIINSRWEDVDFNKGLWCIGADEMKKDRDFLVPLSRQSVELLHQIKEMTRNDEFIVPSFFNPHKGMSRNTINNVLRKMKYDISGHGFRTTASTILHEQGFLTEIIEKQLAHEDGDTSRKPYNHAEYLEARVEMMQSWADYIDELRSS